MRPRKSSPRAARQATRRLDQRLSQVQVPDAPRGGWVRSIRKALGMTQTQLAKRMGITQQSTAKLENDEISGNVTVERLSRAADALGCDVRYVFLPRQPLEQMIASQAERRAEQKLARVNRSQALEASALASTALKGAGQERARELEVNRASDLWDD